MGTAFLAARHGKRLAGRTAVGTTASHCARKDPADRPQDHPRSSSPLHPLEHAKLGPIGGSEYLLGKPDLAVAQVETASGKDVPIQLSNDPQFAEKVEAIVEAIVELRLHPPPDSVVWSADEQCPIQARTRTASGLPCAPGPCATRTHSDQRHGTTTLFAAMAMDTGKVVYTFHPQHRHPEWIPFLGKMEASTAPDKQIHLIIDNDSAHKHAKVRQWLDDHPRFHVHYTPTSGSWLNQVERLFGEVNRKCLKHRSAPTVEALQQDITQFLDRRNENPKPIHWKATADDILQKVKRAWHSLHDRYAAKKPSAALASIARHFKLNPADLNPAMT